MHINHGHDQNRKRTKKQHGSKSYLQTPTLEKEKQEIRVRTPRPVTVMPMRTMKRKSEG